MNARCVVLDYNEGKIHIIDIDNTQDNEDIEELLIKHYEFKLSEIDWMATRKLTIEFGSPL